MKLHKDQARELEERRAKLYYFPATKISLEVAGMDLATNMALMGCIGAITGLTNMAGLEQAVKDRFLGKGFVVSGGTAALDSVVERKFKKKQELIEKNVAVMRAGELVQYATPDDLLANPVDPFVRDFVGADRALRRLALMRVGDLAVARNGTGRPPLTVPPETSVRDALSLALERGAPEIGVDGDPGGVGTPAFFARARLMALSSSAFMARGLGPMNRILQLSQTSAKWAFSERKP